ncbi:unnamed protein product [Lupinus luteus]|uniref:Uncharacterized protein n=1 Tax=Lupinus luteus TaxID=3873 RepID=A0AAV1WKG1_LUPLU
MCITIFHYTSNKNSLAFKLLINPSRLSLAFLIPLVIVSLIKIHLSNYNNQPTSVELRFFQFKG